MAARGSRLRWLLPMIALLCAPLMISRAATATLAHTTAADFARGDSDGGFAITGQDGGSLALAPRGLGVGLWSELSATPLPRPLRDHTAAVVDGYLFVVGGESSVGPEAAVWRAAIGPDGALGAWQAMPALPHPILRHAMVRVGASLLVIGGLSNRAPNLPLATVYRATVGPGGNLSAWLELPGSALPQPLDGAAATVAGGHLFVIGGTLGYGAPQPAVYQASLSADGTPGAWAVAAALPVALTEHGVAAVGNCLFVAGGSDASVIPRSEVYSAAVGLDRSVAAWRKLDSARLPQPLERHTLTAVAGQLIVTGGNSDAPDYDRDEVYQATVHDDCSLDPWQAAAGATLPRQVIDHAAAASDDYLFVVGGHRHGNVEQYDMIYRAPVRRDQDLGAWREQDQAPLPQDLTGASAALSQAGLFVSGGSGASGVQSSVYRAVPVNGRIDSWSQTAALPQPLRDHATLAIDGRLLAIGGHNGASDQSAVYAASINPDGTLGEWRPHPCALPAALSGHAAVLAGDFVYVSGGRQGFEEHSEVYRMRRDDDGSRGCWQTIAALPLPLADHAMVAAGGYLFVSGGITGAGATNSNAVYRAAVAADGSLSSWTEVGVSPLPKYLRGHAMAAAGGFIYVLGGFDAFALVPIYQVYQAPIAGDGSLGTWRELASTPLPQGLSDFALAADDQYMFVIGGYRNSLPQRAIYATALYRAVGLASFTHAFDLGAEQDIGVLAWRARGDTSARLSVRYRVAPATGDYGAWLEAASSPVSVYARGRYLQYQILVASAGGVKAIDEVSLTYGDVGNYIRVLDERGASVPGAEVYVGGRAVGKTDLQGVIRPEALAQLREHDRLAALVPVSQTTTLRDMHAADSGAAANWAYRTYITNLAISGAGQVEAGQVDRLGGQLITARADRPLVLFNLVISIEWAANITYTSEISSAVRAASQYLFDVSDGQMALGYARIYTNAEHWSDADIQISARNNVQPHAYVGGITSADRSHVIRVGRQWDGTTASRGRWDASDGFRTLIHEFGHYALQLYDEYFVYTFDADGNVTGRNTVYCTAPQDEIGGDDSTNASIMDWQYGRSEFAARGVPGLWSSWCEQTAQSQFNDGESDWETIVRNYQDSSSPPRWRLTSPADRGSVLAGPDGLPADVLPFPLIDILSSPPASPTRTLTIYGPSGPYKDALVVLRTNQRGFPVAIDQGFTDGDGKIEIYGAQPGDILRAASLDGSLSGQLPVSDTLAYSLTIGASAQLQALALGDVNPYFTIVPSNDGSGVNLALQGFQPGGVLVGIVTQSGGAGSQATNLLYDSAGAAYTGVVSFTTTAQRGTGMAQVIGVGSHSQGISLSSTYALQSAARGRLADLFSADGNLRVQLITDTLPFDAYAALMPLSAVPADPPAGQQIAGNAYNISFSGALTGTDQPFVLTLHYDPAILRRDLIDPATLRIYRWEPAAPGAASRGGWVALGGAQPGEDHSISAVASRFGIYALVGYQAVERRYLPLIAR